MKKKTLLTIISFVFALSVTSCGSIGSNSHRVTFDTGDGSPVETQKVKDGGKIEKPADPTKEGYTFENWTYNNEEWSFAGYVVTEDMTLVANWSKNKYKLTLNNRYSNRGSVSGAGTYYYGTGATIFATASIGYTFMGWYDSNDNLFSDKPRYSFNITSNLTLTAKFEGNKYTVTLNPNEGIVSQTTINVQYGETYIIPTPERKGYSFTGWYDESSKKINNNDTWSYTEDKSLTARWSIENYQITYNDDGAYQNPNPYSYTVNDSVTFYNPSRQGYEFNGWYKDGEPITGIPAGSTGAITITAKWTALKNELSVTSEDETRGTVSITSGTGYSGESIIVVATPSDGHVFIGWYNGDKMVSSQARYAFVMPTDNYSLVAKFMTVEEKAQEDWNKAHGVIPVLNRNAKTVTYGLYPQKNVNDSSLLEALNELTTPESNGWYLYKNEYYAKINATPTALNPVFDNGTTIVSDAVYWFKCEPITWKILSETDGVNFLLSTVLLDAHIFDNSSNYYYDSEIKHWLNDEFYNSAFALENSYLQTRTEHKDKVFLPSREDYLSTYYGFVTSTKADRSRYCRTTDWARARGASYNANDEYGYNGYYWTSSSSTIRDNMAQIISRDGSLSNTNIDAFFPSVRPAISFKMD